MTMPIRGIADGARVSSTKALLVNVRAEVTRRPLDFSRFHLSHRGGERSCSSIFRTVPAAPCSTNSPRMSASATFTHAVRGIPQSHDRAARAAVTAPPLHVSP